MLFKLWFKTSSDLVSYGIAMFVSRYVHDKLVLTCFGSSARAVTISWSTTIYIHKQLHALGSRKKRTLFFWWRNVCCDGNGAHVSVCVCVRTKRTYTYSLVGCSKLLNEWMIKPKWLAHRCPTPPILLLLGWFLHYAQLAHSLPHASFSLLDNIEAIGQTIQWIRNYTSFCSHS